MTEVEVDGEEWLVSLFRVVESTEVGESSICSWTRSFDLHLEMLINDTFVVVSNPCLLGFIVYRVVIFVEIIHWIVFVRRRRVHLSGGWIPPVLGLAKAVPAFRLIEVSTCGLPVTSLC